MVKCGVYENRLLRYRRMNSNSCYRPSQEYPEYPFSMKDLDANRFNPVYDAFRILLFTLGLDLKNYGTCSWNPLGEYIKPGDHVLVKPNLVLEYNASGYGTDCLFTHPSLIAAVIDYAIIALKGEGRITLADAPLQSCNFEKLTYDSGIQHLVDWYRSMGQDVVLRDLRGLRSTMTRHGLSQSLVECAGGVVVDLGDDSSFHGLSKDHLSRLRITNYDPRELKRHHFVGRHEYCVAKELLDADVVINLPKPKTHRKAGVTAALKNLVGINVRKEYLPHHSMGSMDEGFDEYRNKSSIRRAGSYLLDIKNEGLTTHLGFMSSIEGYTSRVLSKAGKVVSRDRYSEGSWWGNDTIWRTILDLNKIALFADRDGIMQDEAQRKMIIVSDMVTIGQGEGPLLPQPGQWGMLLFADDSVVHDIAVARLLGSDMNLIPSIREAAAYEGRYCFHTEDPVNAICVSNNDRMNGLPVSVLEMPTKERAKPTMGWEGHFWRDGS